MKEMHKKCKKVVKITVLVIENSARYNNFIPENIEIALLVNEIAIFMHRRCI